MQHNDFDIFADYNTVEIRDAGADEDESIIDQTVTDLLTDLISASPGVVSIGTARRTTVPVTVTTREDAPVDDDLSAWDHVADSSIVLTGEHPVVRGGSGDPETAPHLDLTAGTYRVRAYYAGLETISDDGLHGDDHYQLVLWPGIPVKTTVVKRFTGEMPGG